MKKYICLRDDDTNYFTTIDELKSAYGQIWGRYPITLATVPFAHGSERKIMDFDTRNDKFKALREWERKANFDELTEYQKVHPVGENKDLVYALRQMIESHMIEIAQHGVFHKYGERGAEMYYDRVSFEDVRSGKEYLEKVFGTNINVFIPPSNSIDEKCTEYIKRLNLILFSSGSIKYSNNLVKIKTLFKYPLSTLDKLGDCLKREIKPLRRRNGILMFGSITYNTFDDKEIILEKLLNELNYAGFVALGTHYRLLREETYRRNYLSVVEALANVDDIEFVTATEYYKKMKEKYYE